MTFKEAFKKARKEQGAGGTFTWNGKKYTTNYAEEEKKEAKRPKARPSPKRPEPRPDSGPSSSRPKARPTKAKKEAEPAKEPKPMAKAPSDDTPKSRSGKPMMTAKSRQKSEKKVKATPKRQYEDFPMLKKLSEIWSPKSTENKGKRGDRKRRRDAR